MEERLTIAVDFDGTCVSHEYPRVGKDIGAVPVLRRLVERGHRIILLTMRSGEELDDAVEWFRRNEIPLFGINENRTQYRWTTSKKVHANLYIDDQALGAPVVLTEISDRPYIDWRQVEEWLEISGII